MLEEDFEDWNSDFLGAICNPAPVLIQCDDSFDLSGEDGSDSKLSADFRPPSAFQDDLTFHEMTPAPVEDDFFSAAEVRQGIKDEKCEEDSEPCEAALAIEANLPTPDPLIVSQWRTFISTAYYHPNIMAHEDVACLKELFQLLGSDISYGSINVMIELGKTENNRPTYNIRPPLPASKQAPLFSFANVTDFFIDNNLQVCIVKNYSINDSMKKAVAEMANFIIEYPEALYLETYGFILDFLLRFGISSKLVIDAVVNTQRRRRKSQIPHSVLVLKQANRLGKGKKEFLEKRLLDSPEKKFNPVVPIVTDTNRLRNRRSLDEQSDRVVTAACTTDPNTIDNSTTVQPETNLEPLTTPKADADSIPDLNNATPDAPTTTPTTKHTLTVKKKLFLDKKSGKKRKLPNRPSGQVVDRSEFYISPSGAKLLRRKKSFYHRRDDSQIEKPFLCKICPDRRFAYKGNLVLHMKKHHPHDARVSLSPTKREDYVPPFLCPLCEKGYSSKYKCQLHIRQFHPDKPHAEPKVNENGTPLVKASPNSSPLKSSSGKLAKKVSSSSFKLNKPTTESGEVSEMDAIDIVQQCLEAAEIQPANSSRSSSTSSENSASELSSHSFTSKEQLDIHMNNGINVSFEDIAYTNIGHVATRQLRTAVK